MIAFRKETNKYIYLHWRYFAPITRNKGTRRTLIRHAYTVCSIDNLLQKKLHHIERCFTEINCYSKWLLKQTFGSFKTNNKSYPTNTND